MNSQTLVDWAPWARLLLGAALLTAVLLMVWRLRLGRTSPLQRRRLLLLLTLFLTFDLVLVGSFTRLTDSGLGCPDWPGCYGNASPLGASHAIEQAQTAMPTGPVTHSKAWIEMLHRYLAMAVGGLIVVQTGWAWVDRWRAQHGVAGTLHPGWPTATLFWVCLQGVFGALTVTLQLLPAVVSLHLLGAYILLILLVLQLSRFAQLETPDLDRIAGVQGWLACALAAVIAQSLLGAWVSTNYAVLACNDFPLCQGAWWPLMDFSAGFELWRPLGMTAHGDILSFQALTAIHVAHRLFAGVAVLVLAGLLWKLRGLKGAQRGWRWLAALLALQLITGLSNVVLDWPLVAAMLHTGGAGALIAVLTWLLSRSASVHASNLEIKGTQ